MMITKNSRKISLEIVGANSINKEECWTLDLEQGVYT